MVYSGDNRSKMIQELVPEFVGIPVGVTCGGKFGEPVGADGDDDEDDDDDDEETVRTSVLSAIGKEIDNQIALMKERLEIAEVEKEQLKTAVKEIRELREEIKKLKMKTRRDELRIRGYKNKIDADSHRILLYEGQIYQLEQRLDPDDIRVENSQPQWTPTLDICPPDHNNWKVDFPPDSDSD